MSEFRVFRAIGHEIDGSITIPLQDNVFFNQ
jgi:hypothetical protein